jgi:hypothetical protein
MSIPRTLQLTLMALATTITLLTAGCGGGGSETSNEPPAATAEVTVADATAAEVERVTQAEATALIEQVITPKAADALIASLSGGQPLVEHRRVFESGGVRAGSQADQLEQRHTVSYTPATGSFVVHGYIGGADAIEDLRLAMVDGEAHLLRDLYVAPGPDFVFLGRSLPVLLEGETRVGALAAAVAVPAPKVTGVGGATIPSSDIVDGVLKAQRGKSFNGAMVVNDVAGLTPWQIHGKSFGAKTGKVRLNNREWPPSKWSDTKITIDPTMPWDTTYLNPNVLEIETAAGTKTRWFVAIAPAIAGRVWGQCPHHVAVKRYQLGLKPSPRAYADYTAFDAKYQPRAGDQYQYNGLHTWIVVRVSKPVNDKNSFFDGGLVPINDLLIHEFGHSVCGNHLDNNYHRALTRLGTELSVLALEQPSLFEL